LTIPDQGPFQLYRRPSTKNEKQGRVFDSRPSSYFHTFKRNDRMKDGSRIKYTRKVNHPFI